MNSTASRPGAGTYGSHAGPRSDADAAGARTSGAALFGLDPARWMDALATPLKLARGVNRLLPTEPPSFVLAQMLNQLLLPRLDAATRTALSQRTVEIEITDVGLRCRLALDANGLDGFGPATRDDPVAVRIVAPSQSFWRLASGREDADTLFFERALVMEGDTDFALLLKNSLDAAGPLRLTDLRPIGPRQAFSAARAFAFAARQMLPRPFR